MRIGVAAESAEGVEADVARDNIGTIPRKARGKN